MQNVQSYMAATRPEDRDSDLGFGGDLSGGAVVGEVKIGAFEVRKKPPNAPKISGQMPQIPQAANAPNAPMVNFENGTFAKPTGWSKLWRLERNGIYFKFRLRFTNSRETPQEIQRVTRQGGKISPKIERALRKRPGKGRHEASRVEAGRFRSRAIDLASRIRSSSRRGDGGELETDRSRSRAPAVPHNSSLVRGNMPQLPSVDGASELPGVRESDWVM